MTRVTLGSAAVVALLAATLAGCAGQDPPGTSGQPAAAPPPSSAQAASSAAPPGAGPADGDASPLGFAAPGQVCGTMTFPSGAEGKVVVEFGNITCDDALALFDRYFYSDSVERGGNSQTAQFDGWTCVTPTGEAPREYGYSAQCYNATSQVVSPFDVS